MYDGDDQPGRRARPATSRRRRGAGRRFLVVGDVLDGVIVRTAARAVGDDDPAASIHHRSDGAAGNVATWLGVLGADVALVGRVGIDDVHRHEVALRAAGVRPHLRHDGGSATGAVVSISSPNGTTALSDPGASGRIGPDDVDAEVLHAVDIALLTGDALFSAGARTVHTLVERVRRGAGRTAVDPSSAARVHEIGPRAFLDAVDGVDLLLPGADEARALTGLADPVEAATRLTDRVPLVVVTCGEDGVVVARPGRAPQRVPATPASVVDPNGAGDAFAAGFLCAWATDPVRVGSAAREGARVAARVLGVIGARPLV